MGMVGFRRGFFLLDRGGGGEVGGMVDGLLSYFMGEVGSYSIRERKEG
jgi:hypothetical protein